LAGMNIRFLASITCWYSPKKYVTTLHLPPNRAHATPFGSTLHHFTVIIHINLLPCQ